MNSLQPTPPTRPASPDEAWLVVGWERALLGAMAGHPAGVPDGARIVAARHLIDPRHQRLLEVAAEEYRTWHQQRTAADLADGGWVNRWATRGGLDPGYLRECLGACPFPARLLHYAEGLVQAAAAREARRLVAGPATNRSGHTPVDTRLVAGLPTDREQLLAELVDALAAAEPARQHEAAVLLDRLSPGVFGPGLDRVYEALLSLHRLGAPVDSVTVQMAAVQRRALDRLPARRLAAAVTTGSGRSRRSLADLAAVIQPKSSPTLGARQASPAAQLSSARLQVLLARLPRPGPTR
jgi:hypothetical protein